MLCCLPACLTDCSALGCPRQSNNVRLKEKQTILATNNTYPFSRFSDQSDFPSPNIDEDDLCVQEGQIVLFSPYSLLAMRSLPSGISCKQLWSKTFFLAGQHFGFSRDAAFFVCMSVWLTFLF